MVEVDLGIKARVYKSNKYDYKIYLNLKNSNKTLNDFLCDLFNLSQKDISNKNSIYNKVAEKIISPIDIDR